MKKIRYTALILCMVVILAFTGAAFAYSASNISSMYDFSAGVTIFPQLHIKHPIRVMWYICALGPHPAQLPI